MWLQLRLSGGGFTGHHDCELAGLLLLVIIYYIEASTVHMLFPQSIKTESKPLKDICTPVSLRLISFILFCLAAVRYMS